MRMDIDANHANSNLLGSLAMAAGSMPAQAEAHVETAKETTLGVP